MRKGSEMKEGEWAPTKPEGDFPSSKITPQRRLTGILPPNLEVSAAAFGGTFPFSADPPRYLRPQPDFTTPQLHFPFPRSLSRFPPSHTPLPSGRTIKIHPFPQQPLDRTRSVQQ